MNFKIGFAVGFAAGYWVGSTPAQERRARLESLWSGVRENPRVQHISDAVTSDAHRLADAVEQRVVATADRSAGAVAGKVEAGEGNGRPSSGRAASSGSESGSSASGRGGSGRTTSAAS
jgi:hypothetical protein